MVEARNQFDPRKDPETVVCRLGRRYLGAINEPFKIPFLGSLVKNGSWLYPEQLNSWWRQEKQALSPYAEPTLIPGLGKPYEI